MIARVWTRGVPFDDDRPFDRWIECQVERATTSYVFVVIPHAETPARFSRAQLERDGEASTRKYHVYTDAGRERFDTNEAAKERAEADERKRYAREHPIEVAAARARIRAEGAKAHGRRHLSLVK